MITCIRLFVFLLAINSCYAQAQQKTRYTVSAEGGLLIGNNDKSDTYLFSNGFTRRTVSLGIGAGVDNYLFRSVPLFIDVRKDFGYKLFQPFFNYSAGLNINAVKKDQKGEYRYYQNADFRNGFFTKVSSGVSFRATKICRFYTSLGYSYKTTRIKYDDYIYSPGGQQVGSSTDSYRMNRWYLSFGVRF